jgi:hypothetical protein
MRVGVVAMLFAVAFSAADAAAPGRPDAAELCLVDAGALSAADAPLLPIGAYRALRVSDDARAQRLFEQGMVYGWGFNFAEALRSFRAAVLADRGCALCRWGIAWSLGPSINHDMQAADVPIALDALVQARAYAAESAERERALIDALSARYSPDPHADVERLAAGYADAMRAVAARFPDDADIAVLTAEAIMNAHPYDYWQRDGRPHRWTSEIERLLQRAIKRVPDHLAAHHYRIHLFEDSPQPERALDSAAKLPAVAPGIGHLLHMPSHVYLRIGRYHDAVLANQAAAQADRDYLKAVKANPEYAINYVPHNLHYLWVAALWSGESATAREAAAELAAMAARLPAAAPAGGTAQHFLAAPWLTDLRFERWDALLARPRPAVEEQPYLAGLVAFARGIAQVRRGDSVAATSELARLERALDGAARARLRLRSANDTAEILQPARWLLKAELAAATGDAAGALRSARAAVAAEDRLQADEPAAWLFPSRHTLARLLLDAGRVGAARTAYQQDLKRNPENALALHGLAVAEERLGRGAEAARWRARAASAWQHADTALPSR